MTLKPDATSMLSLFWVLLVVAQPTVNANRAMTLIVLNVIGMFFISFQFALFLICYRQPLARTHPTGSPLDLHEVMPSNAHFCPCAFCRTVGLWSY
jgi:hypothetical protein